MVARQETSDFQILAHFTKFSQAGVSAHIGGRTAKFVAEGVREVAVAGKPEFQGEPGEIVRSVGQPFERGAQAQLGEVAMYGQSGVTMKETCEMKRRHMNGASHFVERYSLTQSAGEVGLGGLGTLCVIGASAVSAGLERLVVVRERCFKNVRDDLKSCCIGPKGFERICFRASSAAALVRGASSKRGNRRGW